MDPTPAPPFELVAIDVARGIRRRWRVAVLRDLFGAWLVETQWGPIGAAGQSRCRAFVDRAAADAHVRALLARRSSAPRRIGVAYRPR